MKKILFLILVGQLIGLNAELTAKVNSEESTETKKDASKNDKQPSTANLTALEQFVNYASQGNIDEMEGVLKNQNLSAGRETLNFINGHSSVNDGVTALIAAAYSGQFNAVQWLLQKGASVTAVDNNGATALIAAAYNGQLNAVQWLLQKGASVTAVDKYGNTALNVAAQIGNLQVVYALISSAQNTITSANMAFQLTTPDNYGFTPLISAMNGQSYSIVIVEALVNALITNKLTSIFNQTLNLKVKNTTPTQTYLSALIASLVDVQQDSAICQVAPIVQTLIEHGADVNASPDTGTALINAAWVGKTLGVSTLPIVQALFAGAKAAGTKVNIDYTETDETNHTKHTVWDFVPGSSPMCQYLLSQGGTPPTGSSCKKWVACPAGCYSNNFGTPNYAPTPPNIENEKPTCSSPNRYQVARETGCFNSLGTQWVSVKSIIPGTLTNCTSGTTFTNSSWSYQVASSCSGAPEPAPEFQCPSPTSS